MSAVQVEMEQNNNEDQLKACGTEGSNGGSDCNTSASAVTSNNISTTAAGVNTAATVTPTTEATKDTNNAQDEKVILADKYKNQGNDYLKGKFISIM